MVMRLQCQGRCDTSVSRSTHTGSSQRDVDWRGRLEQKHDTLVSKVAHQTRGCMINWVLEII